MAPLSWCKKKLKGGEGGGRGHNAGRIYLSQFSCSLSRFVGCVLQSNKQLKFCCVHLNTQKKTIARWLCVSLLHCMNPLAPSKKAIKFRLKVCRRCSILLCSQNNTVCMHIWNHSYISIAQKRDKPAPSSSGLRALQFHKTRKLCRAELANSENCNQ